jgi:hypothetical protein
MEIIITESINLHNMFTTTNEQDFFMNHLSKNMKVLEYGSGSSTKEIAKMVDHITSVEHQIDWYNELVNDIPINCRLILKTPDLEYVEGFECGSYEQFSSYIEAPIEYGPYDIILIDGRARVSCASIVSKMATDNTIVFVHDYDRIEYKPCEKYLKLVDICEKMAKFTLI